jgi:integrase
MATRKNSRNAHGSGTIRQRSDGRWEARVTIGRDPGTGQQRQRSFYGVTQAEARKKLQQALISVEEGTYIEPSKLTVKDWFEIWLNEYNCDVKPRTFNLYTGQVNFRIIPAIGAIKLTALKHHDVQMFLNQQLEAQGDKKALSAKSLKNLHGILHKALEQAVLCEYIKRNPSTACKLPRWKKPDIKPLDDEQIASFLKEIKGNKHEIFYKVDLFTGLRQGEMLGLTKDCIRGDTLHIYRQLQLIKGKYVFCSLKNDKTRTITPAPAVMNLLNEQLTKQAEMKKKAGSAWDNAEGFVFTDELGKHLARHTIYKGFKRIVDKLDIPTTRFHDMRHSYAVVSMQSGDNVKTVQENMGHHSAAFTLDVYGHFTERMRTESATRMDNYIQSVTSA